jgi:hydrogenase maturation protease
MTAIVTHPSVRIVVCGNADRGDDGAALAAVATLLPTLPRDLLTYLEVRRCPELRVEDLVDLPQGSACLILDAVAGPEPGEVVRVELSELREQEPFSPRSSHQLPIVLVLGLAGVMRQRPIAGAFVGIAGRGFGFGAPLSRAVRSGMAAYRRAIESELRRLTAPANLATDAGDAASNGRSAERATDHTSEPAPALPADPAAAEA